MDLHVSVKPETLFSLGPLNVTNSFITMILVMVGLVVVGHLIARRATLVPSAAQSIFEITVEFMLDLVGAATGRVLARRIFPLIGGLFIFIIVANYAGLLPGVGTVGLESEEEEEQARVALVGAMAQEEAEEEEHEEVLKPFLRSPSADLNMTLAMAVFVFIIFQYAGIAAHGVGGRIKHMADPWWIFPLEVVQELARIISLSFRLFGNIFAGEVLVAVMIAFGAATIVLTPVTTVFLFLEVLFGFIQALVFALLSLIYLALATDGGRGLEGEDAHGH